MRLDTILPNFHFILSLLNGHTRIQSNKKAMRTTEVSIR